MSALVAACYKLSMVKLFTSGKLRRVCRELRHAPEIHAAAAAEADVRPPRRKSGFGPIADLPIDLTKVCSQGRRYSQSAVRAAPSGSLSNRRFRLRLPSVGLLLVDVMPPDTWELSVAGILGVLIGAAHYRGSVK
jgi:hypothetical protein